VQASIDMARAAYGDVHNIALDLRPAMLDRLGLIPTLQWYARQQAKYARCEIAVEADAFPGPAAFGSVDRGVPDRPGSREQCSGVTPVRNGSRSRARYRPGCVELRIRDDGVG